MITITKYQNSQLDLITEFVEAIQEHERVHGPESKPGYNRPRICAINLNIGLIHRHWRDCVCL